MFAASRKYQQKKVRCKIPYIQLIFASAIFPSSSILEVIFCVFFCIHISISSSILVETCFCKTDPSLKATKLRIVSTFNEWHLGSNPAYLWKNFTKIFETKQTTESIKTPAKTLKNDPAGFDWSWWLFFRRGLWIVLKGLMSRNVSRLLQVLPSCGGPKSFEKSSISRPRSCWPSLSCQSRSDFFTPAVRPTHPGKILTNLPQKKWRPISLHVWKIYIYHHLKINVGRYSIHGASEGL